jgi:hypothetical protein
MTDSVDFFFGFFEVEVGILRSWKLEKKGLENLEKALKDLDLDTREADC